MKLELRFFPEQSPSGIPDWAVLCERDGGEIRTYAPVNFWIAPVGGRDGTGPDAPVFFGDSEDGFLTTLDGLRQVAVLEGFVKWDGCSHMKRGEDPAMIHVCGAHSWKSLAQALAAIPEMCVALGLKLEDM